MCGRRQGFLGWARDNSEWLSPVFIIIGLVLFFIAFFAWISQAIDGRMRGYTIESRREYTNCKAEYARMKAVCLSYDCARSVGDGESACSALLTE